MKISKSKQELARIISENGGWRDWAGWSVFGKKSMAVVFVDESNKKPIYDVIGKAWPIIRNSIVGEFSCSPFPNWHRTILSRAEYFHLYPVPDAKPEFCESVMRSIPEPEINSKNINITQVDDINVVESKPTIEQLAADYRNAKDYADRKQQEADAAKADADEKTRVLELAGEALGLLVSPITEKQEPELVITDWRDLRVGDIVWVDAYDGHDEGQWPVNQMERASYDYDYAFSVKNSESCERWVDATKPWRFIRRP